MIQPEVKSNYAYFPVVFEEKRFGSGRDEVFEELARNGIMARKYFYPLTSTFSVFCGKYDARETPVALDISKRILSLPLYADLLLDDVDRICSIVVSCGVKRIRKNPHSARMFGLTYAPESAERRSAVRTAHTRRIKTAKMRKEAVTR